MIGGDVVARHDLGVDLVEIGGVEHHFLHRLARVELGLTRSGLDLTRPSVILRSLSPPALVECSQRLVTADDISRWTALGLALASADLSGVMGGAVALACEYAKERKQYGAAIGSFQAIQHMLADAFALTEGARSITLHAAWAVRRGSANP